MKHISPQSGFSWNIIVVIVLVAAFSVAATVIAVKGYSLPFLTKRTVMVDTTGWKTYTDQKAGFSLQYPPDVAFNSESKSLTQNDLWVTSEPMNEIQDRPIVGGINEAIADREALAKGEIAGAGFASEADIVKVGALNGKTATTLAQFEACSVMFVRTFTFYPNNYRVTIGFSGVKDQIMGDMPDYFQIDTKKCGDQKMWKSDKNQNFLQTLKNGMGGTSAQNWYDTFNAVVKSITLSRGTPAPEVTVQPPAATPTPMPSKATSCGVSDNGLCNIITDLTSMLTAKNYEGFLAYQNLTTVTCDPDGMAVSVCDGSAKGTVKEGYGIGYNQSEGTLVSRSTYVTTVTGYIATNGPFTLRGTAQSADRATIVFLNGPKDHILVFPMNRTGATWRTGSLLVGGTFGDQSFNNLSNALLNP